VGSALAAVPEHRNPLAAERTRIDIRFSKQLHRTSPKANSAKSNCKNRSPEKKTPQAFRVRGLSNEAPSSSQTPAPFAVAYYGEGTAAKGVHLKSDEESRPHDRGYDQTLSTL
jgi:hypothetical protein